MWRLLITCCMVIGFIQSVQGQWSDTTKFKEFDGQPLDRVLIEIQNRTSNSFAYEPRTVSHIVVRLPGAEPVSTVQDFLQRVLDDTGLNFKVIAGVYAIFPDKDLAAQRSFSIFGLVADSSSGEALPYATIQILNSHQRTISNSEGRFSILNIHPDTSNLLITYLGYKPLLVKSDTLTHEKSIRLKLSPRKQLLPSVNIQSSSVEMVEINPHTGRITFNPAAISKLPHLGENDVFASMRWLPGLSTTAETENGVAIRGSESGNTLVNFDGITVYHVDHLYGLFSSFNTSVIKNIQLYKGGFDSKMGERTGGVLQITGKDGNSNKPALSVQANLISANAVLELPVVEDKASLLVAFRRSYTDVFVSKPFQTLFNNVYNSSSGINQTGQADAFENGTIPDYNFYDSNVKFSFKPTQRDAISISYYQSRDNLAMNFLYNNPNYIYVSTDTSSWGNTGGSIKWSRQWNPKYYSYLIVGKSNYKTGLNASESSYLPSGELFSRRLLDSETSLKDFVVRQDNAIQINPVHQLEFGAKLNLQSIAVAAQDQVNILADSTEKATTGALYLQNTSRWNRWQATYGLRSTWYAPTSKFYIQPRALLSFETNKNVILKASAGKYIQQIQRLNEQGLYLNIPEIWVLSDSEDIPVQQSYFLSFGASFFKNDFTADLSLYKRWEHGLIDMLHPEAQGTTNLLQEYSSGGEKQVIGLDALIMKKTESATFWFSYSWIFSQSKFPGINANNYYQNGLFPEHEAKLVAQWKLKSWTFSGAFALASGRYYTPVTEITLVGEDEELGYALIAGKINSAQTKSYHRADVSFSYTWALKKSVLEIGGSVYNLYNHQNLKYIDYFAIAEEGTAPKLGERKIYGLGVVPMVYVKLRL